MKKFVKVLLCMVLTIIMALSSVSVAFAKENVTPVILVHGLGANSVYVDPNTDTETEIANLGLGDLASGITNNWDIVLEVVKMLDPARKTSKTTLLKAMQNWVSTSNLNCDENGNVYSNQGINDYWTDSLANHKSYWQSATVAEASIARQMCNSIGAKNVYVYNYDWRVDICQTAKGLNNYIKTIKANTGAKKVTLVGCSLGGSVLSAYIDAYKSNKDLDRCVFVNPAFMGVDVARAFSLDLTMNKKTVINYIKVLAQSYDGGSQKTLINTALAIGDVRVGYAADYLSKALKDEAFIKKFYLTVLKPWLGNIPSLWECIPYDNFNASVKAMSKIGFLDKNSGLYTKITKYHKVQGRLKSNLKAIKKQGVQVAIIAGYGAQGIPITSKYANQTDFLIDTKYASGGATVAKQGKKLTGKNAKGNYVSKDKAINAKTCALPDNTWFIKDLLHMRFKYNSQATKLVANIATGKIKSNIKAVKSKYGYSQFLKVADGSTQNLKNV